VTRSKLANPLALPCPANSRSEHTPFFLLLSIAASDFVDQLLERVAKRT